MEKLNKIIVFFSDKDSSSKKLISFIKEIPNQEKYISFVNIHTERKITKEYSIKYIPSVYYEKEIYTGDDTISLLLYVFDINIDEINDTENKDKQKEINQNKKDITEICEEDQFCNITELEVPKFKSITEKSNFEISKDLDTDIERYNRTQKEIDNLFKK
jgi:hypothetical protein